MSQSIKASPRSIYPSGDKFVLVAKITEGSSAVLDRLVHVVLDESQLDALYHWGTTSKSRLDLEHLPK